jgi:hypothetical protein
MDKTIKKMFYEYLAPNLWSLPGRIADAGNIPAPATVVWSFGTSKTVMFWAGYA